MDEKNPVNRRTFLTQALSVGGGLLSTAAWLGLSARLNPSEAAPDKTASPSAKATNRKADTSTHPKPPPEHKPVPLAGKPVAPRPSPAPSTRPTPPGEGHTQPLPGRVRAPSPTASPTKPKKPQDPKKAKS